jgi:hypothetical protein
MLVEWLTALEGVPLVAGLRNARWTYAAVNASHIVGIALLFGAIVPLDLRLIGFWRAVPIRTLARSLVPVAMAGLLLAVAAGSLLFSVRATEYAAKPVFQIKLVLILCAVANALLLRRAVAWETARHDTGASPPARLRVAGALSIMLWLGVIASGRSIAFVD